MKDFIKEESIKPREKSLVLFSDHKDVPNWLSSPELTSKLAGLEPRNQAVLKLTSNKSLYIFDYNKAISSQTDWKQ